LRSDRRLSNAGDFPQSFFGFRKLPGKLQPRTLRTLRNASSSFFFKEKNTEKKNTEKKKGQWKVHSLGTREEDDAEF